jgi:hypothetical protein
VGTIAALTINWKEAISFSSIREAVEDLVSEKKSHATKNSGNEKPMSIDRAGALMNNPSDLVSPPPGDDGDGVADILSVCICDDGLGNVTFNVTIQDWPTTGGPWAVGILYTTDNPPMTQNFPIPFLRIRIASLPLLLDQFQMQCRLAGK